MGTNYYIVDRCDCCGRSDWTHICKNMTGFQALIEEEDWTPHIIIGSWAEWKERLRQPGTVIENEYGEVIDVAEFIEDVEGSANEARRWQYDWYLTNMPDGVASAPAVGKTWLDPDGFTFSGFEFS